MTSPPTAALHYFPLPDDRPGNARSAGRSGDGRRAADRPVYAAAPPACLHRLGLRGVAGATAYEQRLDRGFRELETLVTGPLLTAARDHLCAAGGRAGPADATVTCLGLPRSLRIAHPAAPTRPAAYVAAPIAALNAIIARHADLGELLDSGWLRLYAVYDGGALILCYRRGLHWESASVQDAA